MRRSSSLALAAALVACAHPGTPPGGPEDHAPPKLVKITPDTGHTNVKPKEVVFRFDEVVSERPGGPNGLEGLFVLSPSDGEARVSWHRSAITVRPHRGFRPNTAYTVTMLPGITDLRGNQLKEGAVAFFSTGGEIPATALRGRVFDWVAGKPAPRALVQAFRRGDTTFAWIGATDSTGAFTIRGFPSGSYVVRGVLDANNNRVVDPREAWDTLGVAIADSGTIELLAFAHDTVGPRIDRLTVEDSVTLRVEFDKPFDPVHPPTAASFVVLRADSSVIAPAALLTDSSLAAEQSARDTTSRAVTDSARGVSTAEPPAGSRVPLPKRGGRAGAAADTMPVPKPSRPSPEQRVILRLATPLAPASSYRLRATNIAGLWSRPRTSDRVFSTAKPAAPRDSSAARPSPAAPPRRP